MKSIPSISKLLISAAILASTLFLSACEEEMATWDNVYQFGTEITASTCQADSVFETLDGGFLAAGLTKGLLSILKVDYDGTREWALQYDCAGAQFVGKWAFDIRETQEGYAVAMIMHEGNKARIVRLDPDGNETGSSIVSDPSIKSIESLTLTPENTLTLAGKTDTDILVMGFDQNGNAAWDAHYGNAESDSAQVIRKTKEGYVAGGMCGGMTRIFKLDDAGDVVWRRTLPTAKDGAQGVLITALDETDGGGFKLGVFVIENDYPLGTFVYSLRSCGLTIAKTELSDIIVNGIRQTSDKGFVLIGDNAEFNGNYYGVYAARYSSLHKEKCSKLLTKEDTGHEMYGFDITETTDGGYLLCGMKDGAFWLNKRNNMGEMGD